MELKKLQCTSCGSALEIKPGIDRVRCPFCGMTYLIERKETPQTAGGRSVTGDNPVDVILVPLPENTITFDRAYTNCGERYRDRWPDTGYGDGFILDSYYATVLKDIDEALMKFIKLLASLAYVTKETYTLDIGNLAVDPVYMYYDGSDEVTGKTFSAKEIGCLVEPNKAYHDNVHHHIFTFDKPRNGRIWYDKKKNEKANRENYGKLNSLMKKYHMEYVDEVKYSEIHNQKMLKKTLFGRKEYVLHWTQRYTDRRLFINMNADLAKEFLSGDDIAKIERIGKVACITDMAAIIYREFSKDAKYQLNKREYGGINVEVRTKSIWVGNKRNTVLHREPSGRTYPVQVPIEIMYSNYGMEEIDSLDLEYFLTAHLINRINYLIKVNKDTKWNLTSCYGYVREEKSTYHNNIGVRLSFSPSLKTVGVYNSWV